MDGHVLPMTGEDLLELLEDRYGFTSTIVTSQLTPDNCHPVIGDPTLADAICDRLVQKPHRIKLARESIRKEEGLTATKKPAK
jgi:DNA replication protein DnaC